MTPLRFALLLQRRLSRRDLPLLLVTALLTALALTCALGGPGFLAATLDGAVRQAVASDSDTDLLIRTRVASSTPYGERATVTPADLPEEARKVRALLPPALRAVVAPAIAAVVGPDLRLTFRDTTPALQNGPVGLRIALLPAAGAVRLRSGALPSTPATRGVVDVVLSRPVADATSLRVGSVIDVPRGADDDRSTPFRVRVTGIVDRSPAADPASWDDFGPVWAARRNRNGTAPPLQAVALTDATGLGHATDAIHPFTAVMRLRVLPVRLTAAAAPGLARTVTSLRSRQDALVADDGEQLTLSSGLPDAIATAERQGRSAVAQFSLLTAGVLGTAAIAIVLLGGLVAARRRGTVELQRARGSAVLAVAAPAVMESAAIVVLAALVAGLITRSVWSPAAAVVAAVALLATPLQLAAIARSGAVRRAPANRSDRLRLARLRSARRVAVEAGLVLVAAVALLVLDAGGGLSGAQANPLLLVAPLLVAAAATVVVLRLTPPVLRAVGAIARRSRGVAAVLVPARAGRARTALPLLALCIASGLALNDGMLVAAIASGQEAAAWDRVGADARASVGADLGRVRAEPGVEHAAAVAEVRGTSVDLRTTSTIATLLAVDAGYPAVAGALPASAPGTAAVLRRLGDSAGPLPVVVDAELARSMVGRTLRLRLDSGDVQAVAVGTVADGPSGWSTGPYVFADLDALRQRAADLRPTSTLVIGPGAGDALERAGVPDNRILTRTGWLQAQRDRPLVSGTRRATLVAAVLLGLLAMAALSAAVLAGAPDRRRTLGLLRTLGMRRRVGWSLLLADLLPLVVGGLLGGAVIGVVSAQVLDPALALAALTGGRSDPPVAVSGGVLAVVLAGLVVVLAAAVAVEALTWRRDRFTEVLRVGGAG